MIHIFIHNDFIFDEKHVLRTNICKLGILPDLKRTIKGSLSGQDVRATFYSERKITGY